MTAERDVAVDRGAAFAAIPAARRGTRHDVHGRAFLGGGAGVGDEVEIHAGTLTRGPVSSRPGGDEPRPYGTEDGDTEGATLSIRIADALNSAVPDFGSIASIVRMFVATSSWKWSVMKARPGRSVVS